MARLVVLRIAGALLIGLALCPLVPLLGRTQWPAWIGPFLGALFGVAMFRTKPAVKIAAALALGLSFNLFREFAHPRIVFLTRWSMPIGFFAGWAVFMVLTRVGKRGRVVAAAIGALLIVGALVHQNGGSAAIYERIRNYRAEQRRNAAIAMQTNALPKVDRVEIGVGVPSDPNESGDFKPGALVVLGGADAERLALLWRSRTFEERLTVAPDREIWYVRFSANGKLLLSAQVRLADGREWCLLGSPPASDGRLAIKDPGGFLLDELRKWAPVPNTTRSALACRDANALSSLQRCDEAILEFQEALRLDPKRAGAYCGIAEAQSNLGQNDRAIEAFSKAIDLWPNNHALFERRGELYLCCGKYQEAIGDFTRLIASYTVSYGAAPRVRDLRGQAYMHLGMLREALGDFTAAALACPDSLAYRFHKRFALDGMNSKSTAPVTDQPPGKQ